MGAKRANREHERCALARFVVVFASEVVGEGRDDGVLEVVPQCGLRGGVWRRAQQHHHRVIGGAGPAGQYCARERLTELLVLDVRERQGSGVVGPDPSRNSVSLVPK